MTELGKLCILVNRRLLIEQDCGRFVRGFITMYENARGRQKLVTSCLKGS